MLYEIYFSPTGGTKKAATFLCTAWKMEYRPVDLTVPKETFQPPVLQEEDVCLVAVPSFGGRIPSAAVERLRQMEGNGAKTVLLCTYGNRAFDDTLLELQDLLTENGFRCCAAIAAVTEHSIMPQYGLGRPDEQDRKELAAFAEKIKLKVFNQEGEIPPLRVPGNHPYQEYGGVPFVPKTGNECTRCGLCAAKCPTKAITIQKCAVTNTEVCISCMRCVALCPQHARKLNKALLLAASQKMKKACVSRKTNQLFI